MEIKLIIAGSRTITNRKKVFDIITDFVHELWLDEKFLSTDELLIISGCAQGIDTLAIEWAEKFGCRVEKYPAEWEKYGRSAGYKRNLIMALNATHLLAIWDGKSKGTSHMVQIMEAENKPSRIIVYDPKKE